MLDTGKVKKLRSEGKLTLEEAAKKAGFSNAQQWYLIESGTRANVTVETLDKIAKALGVKAKDLLK
jgi:transcriptional regulator with XRE-family HTH domain